MKTSPNLKLWQDAHRQSAAVDLKRAEMPPGSSRARVTTANAKWSRWAEERDRLYAALSPADKATADLIAKELTP